MGNLFSGYAGYYIRREESDWDLTRPRVPPQDVTDNTQAADPSPPDHPSDMEAAQNFKRSCSAGDKSSQTKDSKQQKLEEQGAGDNNASRPQSSSPPVDYNLREANLSSPLGKSKEIDKFASSRNRGLDICDEDVSGFSKDLSPTVSVSDASFDGIDCHINIIPSHVLVQIFSHLSVQDLLHKVCLISKYWYDLAHDPDLWRTVNLRGQTKVDDKVLQRVVSYSESVLSVDISDARSVSDDGVEALAKQCTGLQHLKLVRCLQLKESAFVALGHHCPMLTTLHLNCCFAVSDKALETIAAGCSKIRALNISQCSHVSNEGIQAVGRGCPDLRELSMDQCKQVGDRGLRAVIEGCPRLTKLSAMSCVFTSAGISQLTELSDLRHLELHDVLGVTDDCIIKVVSSCRQIEMLNLALCTQITDRSVDVIAKRATSLKSLYLASCDLTNQALISLGAHNKTVETVDVGWCSNITDEGAVRISETCVALRTLALIRCDKVTIQTMDYLVERFPHIHYSTFWLDCRRLMNQAQRMGYAPAAQFVNVGPPPVKPGSE